MYHMGDRARVALHGVCLLHFLLTHVTETSGKKNLRQASIYVARHGVDPFLGFFFFSLLQCIALVPELVWQHCTAALL